MAHVCGAALVFEESDHRERGAPNLGHVTLNDAGPTGFTALRRNSFGEPVERKFGSVAVAILSRVTVEQG